MLITPREEEPQIKVPMIDVLVPFPGRLRARGGGARREPRSRSCVWEIPGVEYVYTTSSPNFAMAIVRFKVGEDPEESLVKLYTKLMANPERIPPGAGPAVVKPKSIDDVPIVALTLWSERTTASRCGRSPTRSALEIKKIPNISEVTVIGGERREIARLARSRSGCAATGMSALCDRAVAPAGQLEPPGRVALAGNREVAASRRAGSCKDAEDVRHVVVGVRDGRPLRLGEVAEVRDGPDERASCVLFGAGPRAEEKRIHEGDPVDASRGHDRHRQEARLERRRPGEADRGEGRGAEADDDPDRASR